MGSRVYIVDYDIPVEPPKRRIQFYRDMKKLQKTARMHPDYSTMSVFRTENRILAEAVYMLVIAHGGSSYVYCGEEITQEIGMNEYKIIHIM